MSRCVSLWTLTLIHPRLHCAAPHRFPAPEFAIDLICSSSPVALASVAFWRALALRARNLPPPRTDEDPTLTGSSIKNHLQPFPRQPLRPFYPYLDFQTCQQ